MDSLRVDTVHAVQFNRVASTCTVLYFWKVLNFIAPGGPFPDYRS